MVRAGPRQGSYLSQLRGSLGLPAYPDLTCESCGPSCLPLGPQRLCLKWAGSQPTMNTLRAGVWGAQAGIEVLLLPPLPSFLLTRLPCHQPRFFPPRGVRQHQGQSPVARLYRLGSLIQHLPVPLGSWSLYWSSGPQRQSRLCPQFLTKLAKGGSLADIDSQAGFLFCPDPWPPFLCPISGHCVPEWQGGMVDLPCTLDKFLFSLASVFTQGNVVSLPEHRLHQHSGLCPSPGLP